MEKKEKLSKWIYPLSNPEIEKDVQKLVKETGLRWEEVAILFNRGLKTQRDIEEFLSINLNTLHDTRLMKDAEKGADKIIEYIKSGKEITNYTDYDADGFGAGVTFTTLTRRLGGVVNVWANSRDMGFGMSVEGVKKMLNKYPNTKLIVTTDNGVVAFDAVEYANSLGIEVVITDHHEPDPTGKLPNAVAIIDPKRSDCEYPFKDLCGAGIAFKLLMLIYYKLGKNPKDCYDMLDIVATSTIADVVSLTNENRAIVKAGLEMINKEEKLIWKVMREVFSKGAFAEITNVDSRTIAFTYAPAINACSRILGSIELPIQLFMLEDDESNVDKMQEMAFEMKSINDERKVMTKDLQHGAIALWAEKDDFPVIVIAHEEFHEGIVGIIAGRLKESFNKPAIVLAKDSNDPTIFKGSGRSIEGFPIKDVLDEIQAESNILLAHGGHDMACGLSIKEKDIPILELSLILKAEEMLSEDHFVKKEIVDIALDESQFTYELMDVLKNLEPYGADFAEPVIGLKQYNPRFVNISKTYEVSKEEEDSTIATMPLVKHLFLKGKNVNLVSWYGGKQWLEMKQHIKGSSELTLSEIQQPEEIYVIGKLEVDNYDKRLKLNCEPYNIRVKRKRKK